MRGGFMEQSRFFERRNWGGGGAKRGVSSQAAQRGAWSIFLGLLALYIMRNRCCFLLSAVCSF